MFTPALISLITVSMPEAHAAEDAAVVQPDASGLASSPIYIQGRSSLAVPANGNGDIVAAGGGMGILVSDTQQVGLRFIYMHQPPSNPLSLDTPDVPWAWGPVLDWQATLQPDNRASLYFAASLGYVYGVPTDPTADNVILPILEGGIGLRLTKQTRAGNKVFVSPELGFVPGAVAPYTALSFGVVLPGRSNG